MFFKKSVAIIVQLLKILLDLVYLFLVPQNRRIIAIGDSHVQPLGCRPGVFRRHLGPITLHRFGRPGEATKAFASLKWIWPIQRELKGGLSLPTIVLSFGEIDLRVHVHRQALARGVSEFEVVDDLTKSAINGIAEIRGLTCARIIFLAPTPPSEVVYSSDFPSSGILSERVLWNRYFCQKLSAEIAQLGDSLVQFLNVSSNFVTALGALSDKYSDGNVHYSWTAGNLVVRKIREAT